MKVVEMSIKKNVLCVVVIIIIIDAEL